MAANTRHHLLASLKEAHGNWVSGEELSRRLGVTRTSIWKHACILRSEGYAIDSSTRKGYLLREFMRARESGEAGQLEQGCGKNRPLQAFGHGMRRQIKPLGNQAAKTQRRTDMAAETGRGQPAGNLFDQIRPSGHITAGGA